MRSANTPADRSKRAAQLCPGAASPALCLLFSGRLENPVHRMGGLVYGDNDYDVAAKKGRVILAVGGGIDVAAKKKGVILAVGGGIDVRGQERGAYFGRWGRN